MKFKEKDRQLTILIEDKYDWLETFVASNTSNIIEIPIGDNNIDFFCLIRIITTRTKTSPYS